MHSTNKAISIVSILLFKNVQSRKINVLIYITVLEPCQFHSKEEDQNLLIEYPTI
jgi:hypothetical protein